MSNQFNPKVSIVIPVYNGSNYVKEAIDSALSQTYDNVEVIVVNDGSTDVGKTDEICKSYGDRIRYFLKENGGVASALNMGIEKMKGEYFSWLSHDDVYYPEKVEKQIEALSKLNNKETIIFSNVEYIDENSNTIYFSKYEDKYKEDLIIQGIFSVLNGMTNGCSILIPRSCFKESGFFKESLETTNDYEMWFRLFRRYEKFFIKNPLIKYRFHPAQGTKTNAKYQEESDILWTNILQSITEDEISSFKMSFFSFYYDIYLKTKNALLAEANALAFRKAKKYYLKGTPEISVIMPCYNSEKYLRLAIESILEQTFTNIELIIVDDFSTDSTFSMVKKFATEDFRIVVVRNKFKKGIAGAMNTGIKLSRGNYITRMDSDDISLPERLEKQWNFLRKNKKFDLCSVNIATFGKYETECLYSETSAPIESLFLWANPIPNAPTMFKTELIKDNQLKFKNFSVAEDYDFLSKAILFGKPAMLNDILYRYRIHGASTFQRKKAEVKEISLKVNEELVKTIVKDEIPEFHPLLTDFADEHIQQKEIPIIEAIDWIQLLLQRSKETWDWNEEEYKQAFKYGEKILIKYYVKNSKNYKSLLQENDAMSSEIKKLMTLLKDYYEEHERLIKIENSIFWKMTLPLRIIPKIFYLFSTQGIFITFQKFLLKLRKKL